MKAILVLVATCIAASYFALNYFTPPSSNQDFMEQVFRQYLSKDYGKLSPEKRQEILDNLDREKIFVFEAKEVIDALTIKLQDNSLLELPYIAVAESDAEAVVARIREIALESNALILADRDSIVVSDNGAGRKTYIVDPIINLGSLMLIGLAHTLVTEGLATIRKDSRRKVPPFYLSAHALTLQGVSSSIDLPYQACDLAKTETWSLREPARFRITRYELMELLFTVDHCQEKVDEGTWIDLVTLEIYDGKTLIDRYLVEDARVVNDACQFTIPDAASAGTTAFSTEDAYVSKEFHLSICHGGGRVFKGIGALREDLTIFWNQP